MHFALLTLALHAALYSPTLKEEAFVEQKKRRGESEDVKFESNSIYSTRLKEEELK